MSVTMDCDIVVFDTETTGLGAEDRVVSLGAVRLGPDLAFRQALHLVFNPRRASHWAAERVHGLTTAFLSRQPGFVEHLDEVRMFFADARLVAHNLDFDRRMLDREFSLHGAPALDMRRGGRCTLREWQRRPEGGKGGLDAVIATLGLRRQGAVHGAFEDALLAAAVLRALDGLPPDLPCGLLPPSNARGLPAAPLRARVPKPRPPRAGLAGSRVVITGEFRSMTRDEAEAALLAAGARRQMTVNGLTDFVALGAGPGRAKLRSIAALQEAGAGPRLLDEAGFLALLAEPF
ncbi:exonuclease domain-containing protein [Roseomonas sp. USHLN139]|uniref:exonuclease domain-containing protein n=1 Tax=Roseomonas sp. USHLN139 TaxID=3081298 RepID=UPI003B01C0E8